VSGKRKVCKGGGNSCTRYILGSALSQTIPPMSFQRDSKNNTQRGLHTVKGKGEELKGPQRIWGSQGPPSILYSY